ncbi:hypothetical protein LH464_17235 [Neorhizobium sp. T786]|uniref:hypothetical protein n=1 Tax=Pseudorhizobium xiangyangii TaxID=2883104 RepID=UPI001D000811|nr:hypothetical protein [Neorhizobium xiangyangii]MCB5204212.1 hypothetical protein [Neorhizobium xiangyangii]
MEFAGNAPAGLSKAREPMRRSIASDALYFRLFPLDPALSHLIPVFADLSDKQHRQSSLDFVLIFSARLARLDNQRLIRPL